MNVHIYFLLPIMVVVEPRTRPEFSRPKTWPPEAVAPTFFTDEDTQQLLGCILGPLKLSWAVVSSLPWFLSSPPNNFFFVPLGSRAVTHCFGLARVTSARGAMGLGFTILFFLKPSWPFGPFWATNFQTRSFGKVP